MYLKKIEINNYRQLQNVTLDFQRNLTVLAGPNNSGKTTLISVLKGVFHDKSLNLSYSDIPTHLSIAWIGKVFSVFQTIMSSNDKEKGISKIIEELSANDSFKDDFIIPQFEVRIQVDYNKETDDIQIFADYIMDLDSNKNSFYFVYRFEPSVSSFEKLLAEQYDKIKSKFGDLEKEDCAEKDTKKHSIKESLLKLYCSCLQEKVYFTNDAYKTLNVIDLSKFKQLFYFQNIKAVRDLDNVENDSTKAVNIISILNNIYNDANYNQSPSGANKDIKPDIAPRIIISKNPQNTIQALQKDFPNTLILYLMNKEKYEEIGALNLYQCFDKMEAYSFGKKYSPSDVLSDLSDDNPDPLMKLLFVICQIVTLYSTENFGNIISLCKRQSKFFNASTFRINKHFIAIYNVEESTITNVFDKLQEVEIIKSDALKEFRENEEYKLLFDVKIKEVNNLFEYLNIPTISTQHGVKGESHTSVVFFANDSYNNPNVRMYDFFNLWSNREFSLTTFEDFYYSYISDAMSLQRQIGIKISELKKDTYATNQTIIQNACNAALAKYKNNIFEFLCKKDFETYLSKQNVTAARDLFKISKVEGVLTAFKLFYVGCSRARKNLSIIVDESKISAFKDAFIKKITDIGFVVEFDPAE